MAVEYRERDGEALRLVVGDLSDDRGIKQFDDASAAIFKLVQ